MSKTMIDLENPLISVITVVYNAAQTLEPTMLSVINQTYKNVEYIIIDGGSTDGTVDIIKKYEDKIAYWVSESDKGIYDAMNKGIDRATGEWINFMNAGDSFATQDVLCTVFERGHYNDIDIIYGNVYLIGQKKVGKIGNLNRIKYYMPFCHQSCFVRTKLSKNRPF